jgi:site-specific DNA-methyltransferase (adenine-specific)
MVNKMKYELKLGDNAETLKQYPDNHFDSIVTDPPYGIEFLGKDWDKNTGVMETWNECFRVLKPGGHILAFSAARTYHNLATNIETAGFEIRDQIMWLYGSGFPKAQDMGKAIQKRQGVDEYETAPRGAYKDGTNRNSYEINASYKGVMVKPTSPEAKQWSGWKTALKPAHEPIVMARKPFKGSCLDNVLKHGVGAMNIDESRVPTSEIIQGGTTNKKASSKQYDDANSYFINAPSQQWTQEDKGRYPSNVIGEIPDYQQYFYCPKVSRAERHIGFEKNNENLDHISTKVTSGGNYRSTNNLHPTETSPEIYTEPTKSVGNNHPTVKPVELMKYLIKLVTPKGGKVLDPFSGSGSTGMACVELGYEYTGCELDPEYIEIAMKRIEGWYEQTRPDTNFDELF